MKRLTNGHLELVVVHVWFWFLTRERDATALSADETLRAARFVRPEDRLAFVAGRAVMRAILSRYCQLGAPEIGFAYGTTGRPGLAASPRSSVPEGFDFNLSHSGSLAALAVCATHRVGIDVEAHRDVERGLADRFFSPVEAAQLSALSGEAWRQSFFRCWTRKEALVKATGEGLGRDTRSFSVSLAAEASPAAPLTVAGFDTRGAGDAAWTLAPIETPAGYSGALAVLSHGAPVSVEAKWFDGGEASADPTAVAGPANSLGSPGNTRYPGHDA